jgi:DDE superfamily endonuclease
MLPTPRLPGSWLGLLSSFRWCFTAPTFEVFVTIVSGWVARPWQRTVTGMLIAAGMSRVWHHSSAHRFFSRAVWSLDEVSMVLLALIVDMLLPPGAPVLVAVDDTVFARSGRKVAKAGWHYDAAIKTRAKKKAKAKAGARAKAGEGGSGGVVRWGHCWVVAGIVVTLPRLHRAVCLPVAFALWTHTRGSTAPEQSKQVLACRLVTAIAAHLPGRHVDVVADCWYAGADGAQGAAKGASRHRGLPEPITLTSRLRTNTSLRRIATPAPGPRRGRPPRIGAVIGTPKDLAEHPDTVWRETVVHRYARADTVTLAETVCLWYGVYRCRAIRVILLRDDGATTGYGIALITTDLNTPAAQIVERYAARWSIEVAFADAKQITGVGEARNRTTQAVDRTVPIGLIVQSLVMLWHTRHGSDDLTRRREQAPWYPSKTQPAYHDMITELRHAMITAKYRGTSHHQPTPQQIHDVSLAWEQAAA